MPRWVKRTGLGFGSLIGAVVLALVILLLGANTGPGRALLTRLVPELTGGSVHITGLSGRLPGSLRVQHVWLSDASGTYLTAEDVVLDWQPLRLLDGKLVLDRLTAHRVQVLRLPAEQHKNIGHAAAHPAPPMPLIVHRLAVADLAIAPALSGRPIALALSASGARGAGGVDTLNLDARPLQGGGHYRIEARLTPDQVSLDADLEEPQHGLLAGLAGLSLAFPLRIEAHLNGPRSDIATRLDANLGPITADASGRIDLAGHSADLRITAKAGAIELRPGIGWQRVTLHGTLDGPFTRPTLSGIFALADLNAAGAKIASLTARLSGSAGKAALQAQLAGITLPGPAPELLAGAPVQLEASARLDEPGRPLSFRLRHPLIEIQGQAETAGERSLAATITLPDLQPIAAPISAGLAGSASIRLQATERASGLALESASSLDLSGASPPTLALLGPHPTLTLAADLGRGTATLTNFALIGADLSLHAHGNISGPRVSVQWQAKLPDLGRLRHGVKGALAAHGTIDGPLGGMALAAQLGGTLQGAPLSLTVAARRGAARQGAKNSATVTIEQARWKSVQATGTIALGQGEPSTGQASTGQIHIKVANLGDFSSLAGLSLAGSADATLSAETGSGGPRLEAKLRLAELRAGGVTGSATLTAKGPIGALALRIKADAAAPAPASLSAEALVDATAGEASLSALTLDYRGLSARLLAPGRIVFSPEVAIRGLRLAAAGAELEATGSLSPRLALDLSLRNATASLIRPFAPHLSIKGRLDAEAKLAGSLAAPAGNLEAHARGLGLTSGLAEGLPPSDLAVNATLAGRVLHFSAELAAGRATQLRLSGVAPLGGAGALDLGINGRADLALLQPALAISGRHIAGELALKATVGGTLAAPAIAGSAVLSGGSFADYQSGLALNEIGGTIALANGGAELRNFTAHAGPGTISLAGSIGVLQPGMPLSLRLTAHDAEPLQSDRIRLWLDSELQLAGFAERALAVQGTLHVRRAEIAIPDSLPPEIAVLRVVRPGAGPASPPAPPPDLALDVTLVAPRQIFVRGRGVDAEFGGRIHVSGSTAAPEAVGSFHLIRGAVSLAGQRLKFTSGTIGFNGGDPTDPTLDLVATTANRATTATLTLGGTVRKPTVTLSSVPELPQDQVLAALLFGSSTSGLSPFQLAEMANALTSLTGTGPSVGNPLGTIRKTLGLDQLSIGSNAAGNPTLQAGRYIAPGVYVGASQSTAAGGTEAQVKIDLTKRLRLEATTGSGGGSAAAIGSAAAPDTRNGSSIGLTYQFQY